MARWRQGDWITPRWHVQKRFEGGMSDIYVVYDSQLRYTFAAKTFKDELFVRDIAVAKEFEREAKIWIDLDPHENVARAYFVERIEGKPFIFLEYVSGGDLLAVIRSGRLASDMTALLRYAIQICDGMAHALSHGISAHRDLKPNNCLVTSEGNLKVTDFGLAMAAAGTADRGGGAPLVVGTMPYMAPEQWINSSTVDQRADVYAFGVMLYQMITQRLPFMVDPQGKTPAQIASAYEGLHRSASVPRFECAIPALQDVVARCLAKPAASRYANFAAIRAALAPIYESVTGEPIWRPATAAEVDASTWSERGATLAELGFYEDGVSACQRAIQLNGRSSAARNNLGKALLNWGVHEKNRGNTEEALRLYRDAIDACEEAIRLNPRSAEPHNNLGLALENLGQADQALACFDRAIGIDDKHVGTFGNKVNLLLRLRRNGDAYAAAQTALKADRNSAAAWFSLGLVYEHQGRINDANDSYLKATELNPFLPDAWSNLAVVKFGQGRFTEAIAAATRALEINPDHRSALSNRGLAQAKLKRYADALIDLDRAVRVYPKDPVPHLNRALPLAMLGKWHEALDACDQAIAVDPNYSSALIQKGAIYAERKNYPAALRCYVQAHDLGDPRAAPRIAQLPK